MTDFSKLAVTLNQLRQANKQFTDTGRLVRRNVAMKGVTPVISRKAKKGDAASSGIGPSAVPRATEQGFVDHFRTMLGSDESAVRSMVDIEGMVGRQNHMAGTGRGRIFADRGMIEHLDSQGSMLDSTPLGKARDMAHKLSPEGREALNRAVIQHEGAELGKQFGKRRFASHRSTRPMLQDMNIASTLEGPGEDAADFFRQLRAPEVEALEQLMPEVKRLNLGENRISRHAQKRIQELYEKRVKAMEDNLFKTSSVRSLSYKYFMKMAEDMRVGPAVPDIGKPPGAEPIKPPKPPKNFKVKVPKFTPPGLKANTGVTSGTMN